eukprot:m.85091 g.85091  ORF g.85091 m.85091 type:complete len:423 (-) comp21244_c0_seq3:215-1483(-)
MSLFFVSFLAAFASTASLSPPRAWSTWNTFRIHVNETLVKEMADKIVEQGLLAAGYNYILIDDGWPACLEYAADHCKIPAPRTKEGNIQVNNKTFPSGFKYLSAYVKSKGLKLGIYTAVSTTTCAGFTGSLGFEQQDANFFMDQGFDFVKYDTCNYQCGVHDGCMQASVKRMYHALKSTNPSVVFYLDAGNPSSPHRLFNPHLHHVDVKTDLKIANNVSELVWNWAPGLVDMAKNWYDHSDTWVSTMDNLHHSLRLAMYQTCDFFNIPDMLTIGQGGQSEGQYRAQMYLWSLLSAPLILGNDLRTMDQRTLALVTSKPVLDINSDPECVAASLLRAVDETEIWGKPLATADFAIVILNKSNTTAATVSLSFAEYDGDFYPAKFSCASVSDIPTGRMIFDKICSEFSQSVPPMDAVMLRVSPK